MHTRKISTMAAAVVFLVLFGLAAPRSIAAQNAASGSRAVAKPAPRNTRVATRAVRKRRVRPRVQTAPTPARISEIQSALAAQGAYNAKPNGKWDAATTQAMKDFQAGHGLTATGKLDALTLQKLGLGSEIAGRAAPLPAPQTQSNSGSSPQQNP